MSKKNKIEIASLKDINITYSETCDIDHLYNVKINGTEYCNHISARYESGMKEADVLLFDGEDDILIGYVPVAKNMCKSLKLSFLSYMVGSKKISLVSKY